MNIFIKTLKDVVTSPVYFSVWLTAVFFLLFKLSWSFLIISLILWYIMELVNNYDFKRTKKGQKNE